MTYKQPIPPLWLGLWVPLLAIAWILPNHYFPWATFHSDALVAIMFSIAAAAVLLRNSGRVDWHIFPTLMALLALSPFAQLAVGTLQYSSLAWVCSAYVAGLAFSILIGSCWEKATVGRAADGLFWAIGIAAIFSVGMQLRQWLGLTLEFDELQMWAAEYFPGRPAANLGQPNQLATLLLWGVLACAWGVLRKKISPFFAILTILFLLFGVVLTQSRIAIFAMLVFTGAVWVWRDFWPTRTIPKAVTFLCLYFIFCTLSLQYLSDFLNLGLQVRAPSLGGASTNLRLQAYSLFLDAILKKPWWGYGWNQLAIAQLAVAEDHPNLTSFFLQSHNLFLDLIIWCGIPIGGGISVFLVVWFYRCVKNIATPEDLVLVLFVAAVGLHAMVELPLHHAYFLLPTGLVMGLLCRRQNNSIIFSTSRWLLILIAFFLSVLLGLIIKDYWSVDASFRAYKLELANVAQPRPAELPDVVLLNDFYAFMKNMKVNVKAGMSDSELEELYRVTVRFPSPSNMFNYAKALALSGKPEATQKWMQKVEHVQPFAYTQDLKAIWASQARDLPAMAAVQWPPFSIKGIPISP